MATIPIVIVSAPGQFFSMVLSFGFGSLAGGHYPSVSEILCRVTPLLCRWPELVSRKKKINKSP